MHSSNYKLGEEMSNEEKPDIHQVTGNSINPLKVPLGNLPTGRMLAVVFGALITTFGVFASLIFVPHVALGYSDSLSEGWADLAVFVIAPVFIGLLLCWFGFRKRNQIRLSSAPTPSKKVLLIIVGILFLNIGLFIFGAVPILANIIRVTEGQQVRWMPLFFDLVISATFIWAGSRLLRKGLVREDANHA